MARKEINLNLKFIWRASIVVFVIFLLISLLCIIYSTLTENKIREGSKESYYSLKYGVDFAEASDYLTEEVRLFSTTGNIEHLYNYWYELKITRTREKCIKEVKKYKAPEEEIMYLEFAKQYSDQLSTTEIHSMNLILQANNYSLDNFQKTDRLYSYVRSVLALELPPEYQGLSQEEMQKVGTEILFDESYLSNKKIIDFYVDSYVEAMQSRTEAHDKLAQKYIFAITLVQAICLVCESILLLGVFLIIGRKYLVPLSNIARYFNVNPGDFKSKGEAAEITTIGAGIRQAEQEIADKSRQIEHQNRNLRQMLSKIVEMRDDDTGNHLTKVYEFTKILLRECAKDHPEYGIKEDMIETIALATELHDTGKIAIPDAILLKPAKLTKEEYEIMKTHSAKGAEIISSGQDGNLEQEFQYAYEIALYHHERYNGQGYPQGLEGDEIPIWAQVASLADVYDALVSDRVYRKAIPPDEAFKMIKNGECGIFNPKLLDIFEKVKLELEATAARICQRKPGEIK